MNPLVRLYRRSRLVRVLSIAALIPLWALLAMVSINSLSAYSKLGNDLAVAAIVLFAAWAWWWSGRRDRRDTGADRSMATNPGGAGGMGRAPDAEARLLLTQALLPGRRALRGAGVLSSAATAATAAGYLGVAAVAQDVLDAQVSWHRDAGWLALMGGAAVARAVLGYASSRVAAESSLGVEARLRANLIEQMLQRRGTTVSSAGQATMLLDEVERVGDYAERYVPVMLAAVLTPIVLLVIVFPVNWFVGVLLLLCAPLGPVNLAIIGAGAAAVAHSHAEQLRHLSGYFLDRLRGLATLRRLGAEEAELERVSDASRRLSRTSMAVLRVAFISAGVLEAIITVAIGVVATYIGLTLLGYLHLPGLPDQMSLRSGLFLLMLTPLYFQPLRALAGSYHERAKALAAAESLSSFGHATDDPERAIRPQAEPPGTGAIPGREPPAGIVVRDLTFSYPGRDQPALERLTLHVRPGERLGIAGPSGAGKSTLLRVLAGDLHPVVGEALIGPIPAAEVGRDLVTWLGQRPYLFPGTLHDNVTLGRPGITAEQALDSALEAGMGPLLNRLPDGMATEVGEGGWGLSGGEAHRVVLARTLLKGAPILLLDEPTAHLDGASERELVEVLEKLRARSTTVIASHSPAVLRSCDRVLFLDRGRVYGEQPSITQPVA